MSDESFRSGLVSVFEKFSPSLTSREWTVHTILVRTILVHTILVHTILVHTILVHTIVFSDWPYMFVLGGMLGLGLGFRLGLGLRLRLGLRLQLECMSARVLRVRTGPCLSGSHYFGPHYFGLDYFGSHYFGPHYSGSHYFISHCPHVMFVLGGIGRVSVTVRVRVTVRFNVHERSCVRVRTGPCLSGSHYFGSHYFISRLAIHVCIGWHVTVRVRVRITVRVAVTVRVHERLCSCVRVRTGPCLSGSRSGRRR